MATGFSFHKLSLLLAATLGLAAALPACSGSQAPKSNILKPIEERRARAMIQQVVDRQGQRPAAGRTIKLPGDGELIEDVTLAGTSYGVAYMTADEATKAGAAVPKYNPESQQLRLVRGGNQEVVLVLYEQAYMYDAGDAHSTTAVTAERKLKRDVEDFIMHVVKQGKVE